MTTATVTTRRCAICKEHKEPSNFDALIRNPDGSVKKWHSYCKPCRLARNRRLREIKPHGRELDAAPFVRWLRGRGETQVEIAAATNLDKRQVQDLLSGRRKYVHESTVDEATTYYDGLHRLRDIYPEVYE